MSPHIWLSILLPVYNVEAYLAECVTSIMQQVGDDIGVQIVIVDDASSDGSWAVAARLRDQYPQWVKLIGLDVNHGVSTARNRLIAEAEGAHIWFVDSDDYLLPGAISGLRTILAEHNPDLILCDYRRNHFVKRRSFYGPTRQISCDIGQLVTGVFKSRKMYSWIKISRRSMWDDGLRFPVGRIFEDIATTPWLLLRARNYYYVPSPWIFYRRRAGSIMHSFNLKTATFNAQKNRDLAQGLAGFKVALDAQLGGPKPEAEYYISDFCANQFAKTGLRFARSKDNSSPLELKYYWELFESCSPIPFDRLTIEYLKRLRFVRYVLLKYAMHVANASKKSTEGDNGRAQ
jgi:glycosyltransferase involved in cell wall biosynthesis